MSRRKLNKEERPRARAKRYAEFLFGEIIPEMHQDGLANESTNVVVLLHVGQYDPFVPLREQLLNNHLEERERERTGFYTSVSFFKLTPTAERSHRNSNKMYHDLCNAMMRDAQDEVKQLLASQAWRCFSLTSTPEELERMLIPILEYGPSEIDYCGVPLLKDIPGVQDLLLIECVVWSRGWSHHDIPE